MKKALTILLLFLLLTASGAAALHNWQVPQLDTTTMIVHALGNLSTVCLCLILFTLAWKYRTRKGIPLTLPQSEDNSSAMLAILVLSIIIIYGFLAAVLYTSWLKGDDFGFGPFYGYGHSLKIRLTQTYHRYMGVVSRTGDIISMLGRLSETRWQVWLITPFFVVSFPFAVIALFGNGWRYLTTRKGILLYWFSVTTLLMSAGLYSEYWRIFWGYAATNTYLWPSICTIFWLSILRNQFHFTCFATSKTGIFLIFVYIFSCYCGASLECYAPFFALGGIAWVIYRFTAFRELFITHCTAVIGYLHGCYILFSSPALHIRAEYVARTRPCDISSLSTVHLQQMLSNLSAEVIHSLRGRGGTEVLSLQDIPLYLRTYFIPYIVQIVVKYSLPLQILLAALACLLGIQIVRQKCSIHHLWVFLILIIISWLISFSYLGGAIPNPISFFPAILIAIIAACYAFDKIPAKTLIVHSVLVVSILAYTLSCIIPSYLEAKQLKKYDSAWIASVQEQIKNGKTKITLPSLFPYEPVDKLGLISPDVCLSEDPDATHNAWASGCFRVESIKVEPRKNINTLNEKMPAHETSLK